LIATSAEEQVRLATLLERIAAGEQVALGQLYDLTSPILYGLLLRMLRQPERAQEALQDCYLRVWHRAETYTAVKGEPIAWLIGVARYRALDALRSRRVPEEEAMTLESDSVVLEALGLEFEPGPEARAVEREGLERLMRCMRGLSEVQRKSVLLAYYEGYSHTELAQAMGAPLGTVKAWIRRGLARLRECLEG
jgi:RNA polymerase sigma-70 factor (ECF subfamily)